MNLNSTDNFQSRHIGADEKQLDEMLTVIGVDSLNQLIDETIPSAIMSAESLTIPTGLSEFEYLENLKITAAKNKLYKSYIGMGYSSCITPSVIARNVFQNPGWYTQYTPYQAEIAQGRLEALLNYQTMVSDLTALPVVNASLLDEGTAAAEAMTMLYNRRNKRKVEADTFFVSEKCLPQTIEILKTRATPFNIKLIIGDHQSFEFNENIFGAILQYPAEDGQVVDYTEFIASAHEAGSYVVMAADLLSLALLIPPGELGADVAVGNTQRFGVPLGYGGPHAAYFATNENFKRIIPGRIIGVSIDANEKPALRMALQTREQHIRREKATSNICTAQALLAIMAGMYGVYHGPKGIENIALRIHQLTKILNDSLGKLGYKQTNEIYFDTLKIDLSAQPALLDKIQNLAEQHQINFRLYSSSSIGISLDETTLKADVEQIVSIFAQAADKNEASINWQSTNQDIQYPQSLLRQSAYLTHPVFNNYHSETKMMRYIKSLENKDLSLTHAMIPLGSCTMKLNAATQLFPVSWPEFADIHPFVPINQATGYKEIIEELESYLNEITGFYATSLQPNSGAQGEYAGLMVIKAFHDDNGQSQRNVALIPSSAHGTNPASAVMAGMKVIVVKCDERGNIDVEDLRTKAEANKDSLSCLIITYPSTHGVFEQPVKEICQMIHDNGGQVYMDGANMNAQVGLTSPGEIGADVCHLNLHKTFSIPHGGGGPGMGPICVAKHLAPYLPSHPLIKTGGEKGITSIASSPWGSPSILLISYAYIKMLGQQGLKDATRYAILNANYIKSKLEKHYTVLYQGENGRVAHELIIDLRSFKSSAGVEVEDVAKRLIDYGFHAPTMSWPVPGTIMIEPTESEDKTELDRFCDAMIGIKSEIDDIVNHRADEQDNVLKNSPHTCESVLSDSWNHAYSREKAAYPNESTRANKFWPAVGRVNNPYGDRNLVCTCPAIEAYAEEEELVEALKG